MRYTRKKAFLDPPQAGYEVGTEVYLRPSKDGIRGIRSKGIVSQNQPILDGMIVVEVKLPIALVLISMPIEDLRPTTDPKPAIVKVPKKKPRKKKAEAS